MCFLVGNVILARCCVRLLSLLPGTESVSGAEQQTELFLKKILFKLTMTNSWIQKLLISALSLDWRQVLGWWIHQFLLNRSPGFNVGLHVTVAVYVCWVFTRLTSRAAQASHSTLNLLKLFLSNSDSDYPSCSHTSGESCKTMYMKHQHVSPN